MILRAYGLLEVKLLEASTFLEAFLLGNLLFLGVYRFLESITKPEKKKTDYSKMRVSCEEVKITVDSNIELL
jgi:hypothetical protein